MEPITQGLRFLRLAALAALMLAFPSSGWSGTTYTILHSFGSGRDGYGPSGPLVLGRHGALYGVTATGGTGTSCDYGCGTVFKLVPGANTTWMEVIIHSFAAGNEGAFPWGAASLDESGNVYGTLRGDVGFATDGIFELAHLPGVWAYSVLYAGWAGPGLLMDDHVNLYGAMGPGDYQGAGAIGEISSVSGDWVYTQLYGFCNQYSCPDGSVPPAPPIWDGKGNMFGATTWGGVYKGCWMWTEGCGTVYEMTPNGDGTWTYHVLHRFLENNPKDGQQPYSGLVMDKSGSFYGATWVGGAYDHGTVFKLAYTGGKWKESILYDFPNCALGCMVQGALARDKAGNLYGTAAGGTGNCGYACGVVFKLSPKAGGKWRYSVVFDLTPETGGVQPYYGVILDDKGNLFGVASRGGKYGGGTAFEITP